MSFNLGKKRLDVINKLLKIYLNCENKKFKDLKDVQKYLNKTKYYKLENLDIMTKLESFVLECFKIKNY